jgi:general secretion pathway protein L
VNELALELVAERLVLRHRDGGAERELGAVEVEGVDPEAAKAALRPLIADLALSRVMVSLRLPAELALRKLVDLPAAAEENLRQVLAFEMDRLTPFPADAVHYDVRVLDRNVETRRIRVELMVLPRAAVDPAVRLLHRLGLEPETVALPRGADQASWRLPLAGNGSGERRLVGRASVALLALAGVLLVAAVYTAFDRQRARAELLRREVDMARKEAEEGRLLEEQIQQLSAQQTFIVDKKRARPPVVRVLNELTRALPDDTWLYRLRLINEELQTFGYSPNASAMIGHIENSPLFSNAQFRAPLTRDQRADAEQFHIAFQVGMEKAH